MENQEMSFWTPAFKIRPRVFLRLSKRLTLSQGDLQTRELRLKENLYPVTLPQSEAAQSMKIILASSALSKNDILPRLPRISFTVKGSTLVYLPFTIKGHEMIQQKTKITMNKNTLEFGRRL